ncbi:MAG: N-acetylmuramoyl-L-alanine amidase [Acidimicrobiia bacterium]|nr:N-acetylmuramoyl-L-alanine amidase [Acidimicrobiia bacterium]
MHQDPQPGGAPAHDPRRRRWLLLAGIALAGVVIVIALVRIGDGGDAEPDASTGDTVEAPDDRGAGADDGSDRATAESPTTTTEPPPPPVALLTPTGIPVMVIEPTAAGYLVLTPCGNTVEISGGEPIGPVRVVIDPGHGGPVETGTVGPNGLIERDLNLVLSDAVLAELEARGISAATTRTDDYMVQLGVRVELADALESEALVSIHHNGPTWDLQDTPGTEVYVQSESPTEARAASVRLGGLLYEEITKALGTFEDVQWSGLPDGGVKRVLLSDGTDTYALVRHPDTPSALVEYGYLTNASEAELFATDEYIAVAAVATADAIEAYLETDRPGTGFVEEPRYYNPTGLVIECVDPTLEPEPEVPGEPWDEEADGSEEAPDGDTGDAPDGGGPAGSTEGETGGSPEAEP